VLLEIGRPAVMRLIEALKDEEKSVRHRAAAALKKLGVS
jgi:HEAT repeat protein